jgi:hypothetical protein
MQVLTCIIREWGYQFKDLFDNAPVADETDAHLPNHARPGRDPTMMAPVIILGALMVFVAWDTSDKG